MPRYKVSLTVTIAISVDVEAESEEDATTNWEYYKNALQEAKDDVVCEAKILDGYEFDVEDVEPIEV